MYPNSASGWPFAPCERWSRAGFAPTGRGRSAGLALPWAHRRPALGEVVECGDHVEQAPSLPAQAVVPGLVDLDEATLPQLPEPLTDLGLGGADPLDQRAERLRRPPELPHQTEGV